MLGLNQERLISVPKAAEISEIPCREKVDLKFNGCPFCRKRLTTAYKLPRFFQNGFLRAYLRICIRAHAGRCEALHGLRKDVLMSVCLYEAQTPFAIL